MAAGSTATLSVGSAAVGGFNGQITLSCTPAAGLTCTFSPTTISPGATANVSTLTVAAAATPPAGGYGGGYSAMFLLSGLGLFGAFFTTRPRKLTSGKGPSLLLMAGLALLVAGMTFTVACGSNSNHQTPPANQATVMVTGTSGAISHTTPVTVRIH